MPQRVVDARKAHRAAVGSHGNASVIYTIEFPGKRMRREGAKAHSAALCRNQKLRNLRTENFTGMNRMNRISL